MRTDELIQHLTRDVRPVRPLRPPLLRLLVWLAIALPAVVVVVLLMSPRPDLGARLAEPRFLVELLASLGTALAAGVAAFQLAVPGRSRLAALLPLPPLALWLGSLGQGCIAAWLQVGGDGMRLRPDWACFPAIVAVGAIPAIAVVVMLSRGAPLAPRLTVGLAGLAAAALGAFGLRFFHMQDASLMVLVWQVGTVAVLAGLSGLLGRHIFRWPSRHGLRA